MMLKSTLGFLRYIRNETNADSVELWLTLDLFILYISKDQIVFKKAFTSTEIEDTRGGADHAVAKESIAIFNKRFEECQKTK